MSDITPVAKPLEKLHRWDSKVYLAFNLFGLLITGLGFNAVMSLPLPKELEAGGHLQFLTNLSLLFTIITIISNILTTLVSSSLLNHVNVYLNATSIILETLVALIYWSLKIFFIHLIVPGSVEKRSFIPVHVDVAIHLFPITFLSIDYYLVKFKNFNISSVTVMLIVISLTSGYWILLEHLIIPPASFPYPFLNVEVQERAIIFTIVACAGFIFYQISNHLHTPIQSLIYGAKEPEKTKTN